MQRWQGIFLIRSILTKSCKLEGSKSDLWEYLVSLPQVENAQNLYPNFSFNIVIVFTAVEVSIKYHDSSKFHYRPALVYSIHVHIHCLYMYFAGKCLFFYGPYGHPYDCFPRGLMYIHAYS